MKVKELLKKMYKRYLLDAMSAFAFGLFSSLLIGLILTQLSKIPGLGILKEFGDMAGDPLVVGAAIGVAVAYGIKVKPLAIFTAAAVGAYGYKLAGPVGAYLAAIVGAEIGNIVAGRTKVDIILVPSVTLIVGGLVAVWTAPGVNGLIGALRDFLEWSMLLQPIPMGIVVSVIFGLALTGPISSAALAGMIFPLSVAESLEFPGLMLAAGAATIGCCCHMIGFAVISYRENKVGGLIAQGIGTSKLQMANSLKHPQILIPPVLASAILGPVAATLFKMQNFGTAAGMGTSGLVGQIGTWEMMTNGAEAIAMNQNVLLHLGDWVVMGPGATATLLIKILLLHVILPAAISLLCSEFMRKKGWIKEGYLKLES